MTAAEFYALVAARLHCDLGQAKAVTLSTLESLRHCLPQEVAAELSAQLPPDMEHGLHAPSYDELFERELFVGPVMSIADTETAWDQSLGGNDLVSVLCEEDAQYSIQAVFGAIKETVRPETQSHLRASLPADVRAWFDHAV